jgi:DNA-binding XRE family transcriptional regulator
MPRASAKRKPQSCRCHAHVAGSERVVFVIAEMHDLRCAIRRLRRDRGITQAELARAVGRSRSLIAEYEAEQKRIPHPILWQIARVLGVRVDDLFEEEPSETHAG